FPKYRSDGLRELLAAYIPDVTLADVWTERNKGIVTPSFQLSAVVPSGARQWAARLLNNLPNVAWMSGTKAIDAILASAAAPAYVFPSRLTNCLSRQAATRSSTAGYSLITRVPRRSPPCLGRD